MTKSNRNTGPGSRPGARLPKGFLDTPAEDIRATRAMLDTIREVYERYGFEPLETPAIEYTDALGKFLPDQDRPNEGVFSFQDEDEQWLSLRYDLTAPLARYVAENFDRLPKPFRRYAVGPVWRNEKPGPGRFRQFTQFDADTVGTDNIAADAEICMLAADTLEALGIKRGDYVIKVSNRKVLEGIREVAGIADEKQWLTTLRAIDKLDRLKDEGVRLLLGRGRKDESGDFTEGAKLDERQIDKVMGFFGLDQAWGLADVSDAKNPDAPPTQSIAALQSPRFADELTSSRFPGRYFDNGSVIEDFEVAIGSSQIGRDGVNELHGITELCRAAGYGSKRVRIDPSCVRGLEYYTGPVFEAELTFEVKNEDGQTVRFGSVGGGGRYDGLVERFLGTKVPATGFSIGVSRLQRALAALRRTGSQDSAGPVVVLVIPEEKGESPNYTRFQKLTQRLRHPDDGGPPIRAEMYLGKARRFGDQMKYANRRGAPCVVIQGPDEWNQDPPTVQIKDLIEGAKAAATIKDSKEWREGRPAQFAVPEGNLVAAVREVLARHRG